MKKVFVITGFGHPKGLASTEMNFKNNTHKLKKVPKFNNTELLNTIETRLR